MAERNKCSHCGGWNDPLQWPEDERDNYRPDTCYVCARQAGIESADSKEEEDNSISPEEDAAEADRLDIEAEGEEVDDD